jgi:proteic killer suppression protein
VSFRDNALEKLETDPNERSRFSAAVVKKFRQRMIHIRMAMDERDFYKFNSLNFERLKGDRSHQYSIRLNDQWRLVFEISGETPNKDLVVVAIEDYH